MPRFIAQLVVLPCLFLPLFTGCLWYEGSNFDGAVWSNDGTEVAYIGHSYMARNAFTYTKKKDYHTRLYVSEHLQSFDQLGTQVGSVMEGQTIALHYMKTQGYLLVSRQSEIIESEEGEDWAEVRTFVTDKVTLDGVRTEVARETGPTMVSCDGGHVASSGLPPLTVIPSPDGKRLVVLRGDSTCAGSTQTLTFLDAGSLEQEGESLEVDLLALAPQSVSDPHYVLNFLPKAWLDDDRFMIGTGSFQSEGVQGWVFSPHTEPLWHDGLDFDCLYPSTTSSYVNEEGLTIYVSESGSVHNGVQDPNFQETTFGCPE